MAFEIGILLAVLALLGWGAYPALLKKVIDKLGEYTCLLFNHLVLVVFIGITAVFTIRLKMPSDIVIATIIVGSIVGAVAIYLYYKAIDAGKVSVVTMVTALQAIWTVVASFFFFDERLRLLQYISIGVILVGVVLAAMDNPKLPRSLDIRHLTHYLTSNVWSKGVGLALLVSFCWALYNLASKYSVKEMGPHVTLVYMEVLILFFILLAFLTKPAKELVKIPRRAHLKWLGPSALLLSLGAVCFYFAMKYAPLSVVVPIIQASPAVTAVTAAAFIGERVRVHQYAGMLLTVIGVVFLSM